MSSGSGTRTRIDSAPVGRAEPDVEIGRVVQVGVVAFALANLSLMLPNGVNTLFPTSDVAGSSLTNVPTTFGVLGFGGLGVAVTIAVAVWAASGIAPRYAYVAFWWSAMSVFASSLVVEGGEQVVSVTMFLLLPFAVVDRRRSAWEPLVVDSGSGDIASRARLLSIFLIQVQVSVIYGHAVLAKLGRETWQEGTAVYYFAQDPVFGPPGWLEAPLRAVFRSEWGSPLATWGSLMLEGFLAVAPWIRSRRVRAAAMATAVGFHGVIAVVFGLPSFFLAMVGINLIALAAIGPSDPGLVKRVLWMSAPRRRSEYDLRETP